MVTFSPFCVSVAGELFPIMANNSETNSVAGITIGFSVGLTVIFGLEKLVGYLENLQSIPVPTMRFERLANCEDNSTVNGIHDGKYSVLYCTIPNLHMF